MRARLKSGIDVIDRAVGGLRKNETYLLVGDTGTGKTIMAQHFVAEGIRTGECCLWVTDEKPADLLFQADSLDMDLTGAVRDGKIRFLQPVEDYASIIDRNTDVLALVNELKNYIDEFAATRVVVDRIGTLLDINQSPQFIQGFAGSLLNFLCDLPCTTFLVDSSPEQSGREWQNKLFERVSFGIFRLGWDDRRSSRNLTIRKMRGTPFDPAPRPFTIVDGHGIRGSRDGEVPKKGGALPEAVPGLRRRVCAVGLGPEHRSVLEAVLGSSWEILDAGENGMERDRMGRSALIVIDARGEIGTIIDRIRAFREDGFDVPVLLMTGGSTRVTDRIRALRSGVDEYIEGPLRADEFAARAGSLLRRSGFEVFPVRDDRDGVTGAGAGDGNDREQKQDRPSIAYDVKSGHFSLSLDQNRKILENMKLVGGLGVHFSLVFMRFQHGAGAGLLETGRVEGLVDRALETVVSRCRDEDILVRACGGEIILILVGADSRGVRKFFSRVEKSLGQLITDGGLELNYSHGSASYPEDSETFHEIIDRALRSLGGSRKLKIA